MIHIAATVLGEHNQTRVTNIYPFTSAALDFLARSISKKAPGKVYYVYEHSYRTQRKKGEPLYVWHIGDGFEHHEGWWVEIE